MKKDSPQPNSSGSQVSHLTRSQVVLIFIFVGLPFFILLIKDGLNFISAITHGSSWQVWGVFALLPLIWLSILVGILWICLKKFKRIPVRDDIS